MVTKYREEIKYNDTVFFWQAGPPEIRGMYGWGVVVGDVKRFKDWGYGVPVKYEKIFKQHISVTAFQKEPLLQKHVLLRMPIGTNFRLIPAEHKAVRDIIVQNLGKEMAP